MAGYTQQPGFQPRISRPPSTGITGLDNWLSQLATAVNNQPRHSWFSGTHPNLSKITGTPGDTLINLASGSTASRLWIMSGDPAASTSTTTGWVLVQVTKVP